MRRLAFAFILMLFPYAPTPSSHAADFTFNIPVEFHKIPADIKTFGVSVAVYDRPPDSKGWRPPESRIGYGDSSQIPFVNGEYTGTVTVQFNAQPRQRPEKAILYEAWFILVGPPGYQGGCLAAMALDTPYPYDPTKPYTCFITGSIPQAAPATTPIQRRAPLEGLIKPLVPPK